MNKAKDQYYWDEDSIDDIRQYMEGESNGYQVAFVCEWVRDNTDWTKEEFQGMVESLCGVVGIEYKRKEENK